MTKKRSTKRALVLSALSLLMCVSMLVGTTFAWFTDTVTSARNTIVSGNLDIVLEYSTWNGTAWTSYAEVDSNTKVFNDNALYEPGYTEVVKFRVTNAGSLALKYNMTAMVYSEEEGKNVEGEPLKLSDYIYTGMISPVPATLDRATAAAAATSKLGSGLNMKNAKHMAAGATEEFALVLSMPTTVGNEANHLKDHQPKIEFGIAVVATQYIEEYDDFDNKYDDEATYPTNIQISTPVADTDNDGLVDSDINITYTDDAASVSSVNAVVPTGTKLEDGATELVLKIKEQEVANPNVTISSTQTATTYEISLDGVDENNTEGITVTLVIAKGLTGVELYHNGTKIDSTYYAATGELTFTTTGFSPFTVVHKKVEGEICDADELKVAFEKGGIYTLAANIALDADETITLAADNVLVLDLNGYTISGTSNVVDKNEDSKITSADNIILIDVRGNLTVKNGVMTVNHEGDNMAWNAQHEIFYVGFNGALTLDNVKLENLGGTDMAYCVDLVNATNIVVNINNCELKSTYIPVRVFNNGSGMNNVTIKNSTVHGENRALWVHIYTNKDTGGKGIKDNTLNFDIFNDTNKFSATKSSSTPICYGFTNAYRYDANGNFAYVEVETVEGLQDAFTNGLNIRLYNDIAVNATLTIPAGKTVIIDLNGKTLSGAFSNDGASALIENKGTLTVKNGKIVSLAEFPDVDWGTEGFPTYATNTIKNLGTLFVEDGAVIENQTNKGGASYAIDCYQGSTLTVNGGEVIQSGGDVAIRMFANSATLETKVVINDGTISGKRAIWIQLPSSDSAVAPKVTVEINGGELSGTQMAIYSYSYGNSFANTKVTITGGTFNGDVQFGGGYKGDIETVTVTGGTFNGALGRWIADQNGDGETDWVDM